MRRDMTEVDGCWDKNVDDAGCVAFWARHYFGSTGVNVTPITARLFVAQGNRLADVAVDAPAQFPGFMQCSVPW